VRLGKGDPEEHLSQQILQLKLCLRFKRRAWNN